MSSRSFILTYHSIDESNSVISVSRGEFRAHLTALKESGLRVVPLDRILEQPGSVALTFDDGFRNFKEHAFPLLAANGMPATVFVVSGYCGRQNNWPTQPTGGVPLLDLMSWSELDEVARHGITIGAHTVTHPHLDRISPEGLAAEMADSRRDIEQRTGRPVRTLAYPYGSASREVISEAARHFEFACTTELNFITPQCQPLELPRLDAYYLRAPRMFQLLRHSQGRLYIGIRRRLRALRNRRHR